MGGHRSSSGRQVYFSLTIPRAIVISCALPLFATLFCVVWSLIFDFEASTRTHCRVYNFLPTISAVIGGFTPQRYVWRICIALHAPQRLMVAFGYYNFHTSVHVGAHNELYKALAAFNSLLHFLEVSSLVCLSMISSTENNKIHENLFISFMACGLMYMLLTIILMRWGRFSSYRTPSLQELTSLWYKTRLFLFNITVFALAVYLFFRHNAYCEPGVYSLFGALEYMIVVSNIVFHGTLYWDFGKEFVLGIVNKDLISDRTTYSGFAFFEYLTVLSNIGYHATTVIDFHSTACVMMDYEPLRNASADEVQVSGNGAAGYRKANSASSDSYSVSRVLDSLMVV